MDKDIDCPLIIIGQGDYRTEYWRGRGPALFDRLLEWLARLVRA